MMYQNFIDNLLILPFEISKHDFKINMHCVRALKLGLPLALQEFLTQISFLALCAFACKIVNFAMLIPSSLMQSMASFVSQNVGAGNEMRAKKAMFTGMGVGLVIGCIVFTLVWFKGNLLTGIFTTDAAVVQNGYDYLKGFAAPAATIFGIVLNVIYYLYANRKQQ